VLQPEGSADQAAPAAEKQSRRIDSEPAYAGDPA
jgi:hypothetical protein